MNPEVF